MIIIVIVLLVVLLLGNKVIRTIPPGHVGVATLFGKVIPAPRDAGLHIVNPLYNWVLYDIREKTHQETASVPTQDQLLTQVDVSVQYRIEGDSTPRILQETGLAADMIKVHLVPKLRSVVREQGKNLKRAEDFFLEETQDNLQRVLKEQLIAYLEPKGMEVTAVLIRDISLPEFITQAIEQKKEREQAVEKQKAELERFRTEQEQMVAQAEAQRRAAEEQAAQQRILADARAYEIQEINKAVGSNPNYIKLQALKSLEAISKDPASKIYFLNGDSPSPLPLLNMTDKQ